MNTAYSCWVVSDGTPGMENPCLGIAGALGVDPVVKRIALRRPWRDLVPFLRVGLSHAFTAEGDAIAPPWPDLLISSGRQSTAASLFVRRAGRGRTLTVHFQDPQVSPELFDLVVVGEHDRLRGRNVMRIKGSPHRVTPGLLAAAAERFGPGLSHLPRPRAAVLIGGSNKVYALTPSIMGELAPALARLTEEGGWGLMVTASRRTGADNEAILRARLENHGSEKGGAVVWDGTGDNPYFGYLALADAIIVTCDSVNMVSEACAAGKPVHVIELAGGSPKFRRFIEGFYTAGLARPFDGTMPSWTPPAWNETGRVADEIRRLLVDRGIRV